MVATADRFFAPGLKPREVWLTAGLSVLLHGLLTVAIVLVPHFQAGTYIKVPVSYTVNLVDAPPGGSGGGGPSPAPPPAQATPAPAPAPAPAVRTAPAPRPAPRPTEELTLPGRQTARKPTQEVEPSLRPPSVTGPPAPRPVPPAPVVPAAPVAPAPVRPGPAAPSVPAPSPPVAPSGSGVGTKGGVQVASTGTGAGTGAGSGNALDYYLTLVDRKIQDNWIPLGASASPETVAEVRFRVLRSGQVRDIELETSSGIGSLDTAALRAVRASQPLPPFPNFLTDPFLDLRYRFVMER